jgi:hypothetical protein
MANPPARSTPAALKQLAITGRLKPSDKVRREDLAVWFVSRANPA